MKNVTKQNESSFYDHMYANNVSGKELSSMNPVFLKYMGVSDEIDQQIIMTEIQKLKDLMNEKEETEEVIPKCVICRDAMATHIAIPCGHVALCKGCAKQCRKQNVINCAYCGKKCDIYKTYSFLV